MHNFARGFAAMAAGAALSLAGVSGTSMRAAAGTAGPATGVSARGISQRTPVPGTQLWVKRYNGPGNSDDDASSVAVSPGGTTVFVTGSSAKAGAGAGPGDYATIAYSAATGARLWVKRYNGPGNSFDQASSVAVGPGGGRVFVTGSSSTRQGGPSDYATVAYSAATGAQLWVKRYNGPGNSDDGATSLAVGPGGGTVFVTGYSDGPSAGSRGDYATIAYSAATGARLWVKRYNGPGNSDDGATSLAVGPGGGRVFVTGASANDYATVAYSAATGAQLWVKRYNGPSNPAEDGGATSVAASPGGRIVFVTGTSSSGGSLGTDYGTVAYSAASGAQLWAEHYSGSGAASSRATSVAVSPTGGRVFVTGADANDYGTVAYSAVTGAQLWAKHYSGPGNYDDFATSVAVSPDGKALFVTGASTGAAAPIRRYDYATVAYSAATGAQLWIKRYNGPGNKDDSASSVAVSPRADTVFVTGGSIGATSQIDYATIAYRR